MNDLQAIFLDDKKYYIQLLEREISVFMEYMTLINYYKLTKVEYWEALNAVRDKIYPVKIVDEESFSNKTNLNPELKALCEGIFHLDMRILEKLSIKFDLANNQDKQLCINL